MYSATALTPVTQPKVTVYPRHDATDFSMTLQVGQEWVVVRWGPQDDTRTVAKQLRDLASWLEIR